MTKYTSIADASAKLILKNLVRRVCLPAGLIAELDAFGLHGLPRDVIYWIVARNLNSFRTTGLHQRLLDKSIGDDQRKDVIRFIKQSRYIKVALQGKFERGIQAKRYYLAGAEDLLSQVPQHNNETVCVTSGCAVGCVVFRCVDFGPLIDCIKNGFEILGWDADRFNAEWSLTLVDAPTLDADSIDAAMIAEKAGKDDATTPEKLDEYATAHRAAYERFRDRRCERINVSDGRTYTSVTSLPRWNREEVVKFAGVSETLDVSACYWYGLAVSERQSMERYGLDLTEIDQFIDLIDNGEYYGRLAAMADMPYETSKEKRIVKQDVQKFCLFGPIGWHPLWKALKSLSPRICRTIQWWHRQQYGKSELAFFLQRIEGTLITRGVVRWLVDAGVPAPQIHDGCIVPEGAAKVAAQWLSDHSLKLYGRRARIAVTVNGQKSYV